MIHAAAAAAIIAHGEAEGEGAVGGRQRLAKRGGVADDVGQLGEDAARVAGGAERAENRARPIIAVGRRGGAEVELLPAIGQRIAVCVGGAAGQAKGRAFGDGIAGSRVGHGSMIAGSARGRTAGAGSRRGVGHNLVEADGVEVGVAVRLQILRPADAGVAHNGGPTARFVGRGVAAIATARAGGGVERMVRPRLMAHFVSHIVNIKRIADRVRLAGHALRFLAGGADHAQAGDAAAAGAKHMADVVVGAADHHIEVALVFAEHYCPVVIGVGVGERVSVDDAGLIGDQHEADRQFALVHAVYPVHRGDHGGQGGGDSAPLDLGIFAVSGQR